MIEVLAGAGIIGAWVAIMAYYEGNTRGWKEGWNEGKELYRGSNTPEVIALCLAVGHWCKAYEKANPSGRRNVARERALYQACKEWDNARAKNAGNDG